MFSAAADSSKVARFMRKSERSCKYLNINLVKEEEKKRRRCSISSLIAVADEGCLPEAEVIVCCHVGEVLSGGYNAL
ncbi:hypothetical protein QL285_047330 [Trifolium repens]|nr:hypothetical protein QL285_047330 [Trifolium repens]